MYMYVIYIYIHICVHIYIYIKTEPDGIAPERGVDLAADLYI